MARLETLPSELILLIAEACTLGPYPRRPRLFGPGGNYHQRPKKSVQMVGRYYGRFHAALARVNRRFHDLLNGPLYTRNLLRDPMSVSCLLFAAETDRVETLQLALRYGADLNRVCDENFPEELQPIHAALAARSSRAVEFMLNHGVDVHLPSSQPPPVRNVMELNKIAYPLYTAVAHGIMEDVASLIDHGAYMIAKGVSALRVLDNQGWPDLVEKVSQRTDPVTLRARLHRAAAAHDMDLVRDVLKYRIHAGDLDRHRQNVLHMVIRAPKRENLPLIELLLQRPDIDATMEDNYGFTPVLAAITRRHINTVKRLMQVPRVRLTGRTAQNETALQLAIKTQDPVLIEYILSQRRTLVDVLVFRSGSALSLASQMGREDNAFATIRLLLARGQPVRGLETQGEILEELVKLGHLRTALFLLGRGLITSPRVLGCTYKHSHPILHTLLDEPHELLIDVLKKLIVVGVDVNQVVEEPTYSRPNHFKRTAATGAQSMECMKLLVAAGAVVTDPDINSLTMLRNIFESFWDREPPSDDPDVEAYAERIRLFLELGATIGRETTEPETTALGYACEAATDESCRLLALLLDNSTAANVDESVVRALISHYESNEKREELKAKEIVRRLEAFEAKIFPK
ncbi:unnamed protein product [Clonostachys rosea f. rosea IK726]|uniref:Uncharacterized protein n=1 Tax=Clonostachys rosea f. rosea IK726 TaxID=1349383 RepID=A0ACA9TFD4_BIOOC|nr:unnamed protein product [Clonostachys rosea f. rosea IK726]